MDKNVTGFNKKSKKSALLGFLCEPFVRIVGMEVPRLVLTRPWSGIIGAGNQRFD